MAVAVDDLRARKAQHRTAMRNRRRAIPAEERARLSALIEERLLALLVPLDPTTVMAFSSFGDEVETHAIVQALHRQGRQIALPVVAGRTMRAAAFRPGDPVATARYGAAEPVSAQDVPPAVIDVVIVPGLVFDLQGFRIGYGRGYYDRFLPRLRPDALRIGIAFHVQVVPEVPHGPPDQPVDLVVTDAATIRCRPDRLEGRVPPST